MDKKELQRYIVENIPIVRGIDHTKSVFAGVSHL